MARGVDIPYTAAMLPGVGPLRDASAHVPLAEDGDARLLACLRSLRAARVPLCVLDIAVDGVPALAKVICQTRQDDGGMKLSRAEFVNLEVSLDERSRLVAERREWSESKRRWESTCAPRGVTQALPHAQPFQHRSKRGSWAALDADESDVKLSLAYPIYAALLRGASDEVRSGAFEIEELWGWGCGRWWAHRVMLEQLGAGAPDATDEAALRRAVEGHLDDENEVAEALRFMRAVRCTVHHLTPRVAVFCPSPPRPVADPI